MFMTRKYYELNKQLHDENEHYGGGGDRRLNDVRKLVNKYKPQTVLDFGCGKGNLHNIFMETLTVNSHVPIWQNYDPCIRQYENPPHAADFVICSDVMEHIEEDFVESTLAALRELTNKHIYFVIGLGLANKSLPDGRNAHITIKPEKQWIALISKYFDVVERWRKGKKLFIVGETRND